MSEGRILDRGKNWYLVEDNSEYAVYYHDMSEDDAYEEAFVGRRGVNLTNLLEERDNTAYTEETPPYLTWSKLAYIKHKPKRRILNPGGGAMPAKIRHGRGWPGHPKLHAEAARKGVLRRRGY